MSAAIGNKRENTTMGKHVVSLVAQVKENDLPLFHDKHLEASQGPHNLPTLFPTGKTMTKIVSVYDGNIPMLSETAALVQNNPLIPAKQRNRQAAIVRKAGRWFDTCATHAARVEGQPAPTSATIPFTRRNLKVAFARLTIAHLDVSKKSVENTLSELNGIADLLGMPRGFAFEALNAECKVVQDRLVTHEDRGSCIRILRVMSAHNIAPARVVDAVPLLREQIDEDWKVSNKARELKRALYAWNKAAKMFADMALPLIDIPKVRKVWGLQWRRDLVDLGKSVDEHLALGDPRPAANDLFEVPNVRPLRPASKKNRKEAARMAASALRDAGIDIATLRHPHDICQPERYKTVFRVLSARAGGVTNSVMRYAIDLRKLGQTPGVLSAVELTELDAAYEKLQTRHGEFLAAAIEAGRVRDRDQDLLHVLDDPAAMDAYLALAHREVLAARRKRNPYSIGATYMIVRALTLEIGHTVSWRIGVAVMWRLDQFVEVDVDGDRRIQVRAPKGQAANKRTPDQFLSPEAAVLLRLFINKYRDILLRHNKCPADTPYLFPGRHGKARHPHTMRVQMNKFVGRLGLDFHPHAIRKINVKVILDTDPRAMELAVRSGGWADDRMVREIYGQKQHDKSQLMINDFVVSRRLRAISMVRKPKKRDADKNPPESE